MSRNPEYKRLHSGTKYLTERALMFEYKGTHCRICGHDGADTADYIVPASVDPYQEVSWQGMQPAHGIRGCPECPTVNGKKRKCNQERGHKPALRQSRIW